MSRQFMRCVSAAVSLILVLLFHDVKGYEEFLICPESPDTRTVSCGPGEVIDFMWARVTNLEVMGVLDPCGDDRNKWKIINNSKSECVQDLPFLSCHGRARCEVDPSMARVWLPGCQGNSDTATRGNWSDVLFVAYMCYTFDNSTAISLPSTSFTSADTFDVISPGFPDVMPDAEYHVTCNLTSSEPYLGDGITFQLERKVVEFEGSGDERNGHCHFTVKGYTAINDLFTLLYLGEGHRDGVFCYIGNPVNIRNQLFGARNRDSWTLRFLSTGAKHGRFWIRITALDENDAPVVMNVSCVDNSPTTTAASTTHTGEAALTQVGTSNSVSVGVSVGVAVTVATIVVILVIIYIRRKKARRGLSQSTQGPADQTANQTSPGTEGSAGTANQETDYEEPIPSARMYTSQISPNLVPTTQYENVGNNPYEQIRENEMNGRESISNSSDPHPSRNNGEYEEFRTPI